MQQNDPRINRLAELQADYNLRATATNVVARDGNWQTFLNRTIEIKGQIAGLQESIQLVPPTEPTPEPEAAVLPITPSDEEKEESSNG